MTTSSFSAKDQAKVLNLFENMNDSAGKDSDKLAKDWLKTHNNHFSGFIDNKFLPETKDAEVIQLTNFSENFATATVASEKTMQKADESSAKGLKEWKNFEQHSQYLQKIAQNLEKNAELFAQVESLSSGKHLYRTRTKDVPNLIQSFHYYSSLSRDTSYLNQNLNPCKVVCVIAEEFNNPMLSVSWRVASVLASASVVLLLVDAKSCPSAFLLAEICSLSDLPDGYLNVLPINQDTIKTLPNSDGIIFTGECSKSNKFIEMAAENYASSKQSKSLTAEVKIFSPCEVLVSQRPVVIVYESADLHSATNGVLEILFFNDTRTAKSGCSVFVQASVKEKFHALLEERFSKIAVGNNFSKTDMSCIVTSTQRDKLKLYIEEAKKQQLKIVEGVDIKDETYIHWNPTLICDVPTTSKLLDEPVEGPIVITTPFRTVKESIAMFNHRKLASDVSIWSEKLPLVHEVAQNLRTRTIWINSQNLFDASIPYGGLSRSGNSIEGGVEAVFEYLDIYPETQTTSTNIQAYGIEDSPKTVLKLNPKIKFSFELHIGGSYKKPIGGTYRVAKDAMSKPYAYIAEGSSADIQAAVSSATVAQQKWQSLGPYKRLKVLEKVVDSFKAKEKEFVSLVSELTGVESQGAKTEVSYSMSKFHHWINHQNYLDGQFIGTETCSKVLQERNPLGVIGIQIGNKVPLWSFISFVIPAIVYGNAVVIVVSGGGSIFSLKLCEIFHACGLPGGTLNVVTGALSNLTRSLALSTNIDAIWHSDEGDLLIRNSCITHPKRVLKYGVSFYNCDPIYERKLISESTYVKSIYMPLGDIFAN